MKGSISKRCPCPVERNARGQRVACKKDHGSWTVVLDAGPDPLTGKRRQIRRSNLRTKREAEDKLAEILDDANKGMMAVDQGLTVTSYLSTWMADKKTRGMRPSTAKTYQGHIDNYIVPAIGSRRLKDVRPDDIDRVLRRVTASAATVQRVHSTMRSAFATAKKRRLISFNPATDVELPTVSRAKVRPWEPAELGKFLDYAAKDVLFGSIFEVIAATGLRRGEAAGLRWTDVDIEGGKLIIRQQIVSLPGKDHDPCPYCGGQHLCALFGKPKTASGEERVVDLDSTTIGVLMAHRLSQDAARVAWGDAYSDHGLVFAREDGTPIPPQTITKVFNGLVLALKLRKIRLHDLRHGQASLMLAAGVPMAVVSKRLGHSTISLTSDTYSHLLEGIGRDAAERASALVPRAPRDHSVTTPEVEGGRKLTTRTKETGTKGAPGRIRTCAHGLGNRRSIP
jgi:integrase